ncbi:MAG: AAA family ATPase [Pirellulaceae bacterium]
MNSLAPADSPFESFLLGAPAPLPADGAWLPPEPQSLAGAGIDLAVVEALVLKLLATSGPTVGRRIAEQIRLPFGLLSDALRSLKSQALVNYRNQATVGDFEYELMEDGQRRARWEMERCTYCGAAPVLLHEYVAAIERQSVRNARPKLPQVCAALQDLCLPPTTISQIGQALFCGRGLFLYGQPGNGKSSIAQRAIRALDQHVWIPRTITVTGEIIRLFDPASHEEVPLEPASEQLLDLLRYDRRWVRIRRPSIVVGGELRLDQLEITVHASSGILESPVQLKSNCGTLVIDDFGRQRCSAAELINRWIVPLEQGHDFLQLPSGRQIQVPFDQLLVFATNFPPNTLVDEAFLRRIPYKIEVTDPSPRDFRDLMCQWCGRLGVEYQAEAVEHVLIKHFSDAQRPMRFCHPRDLVLQVRTFCEFHELPLVLTSKALDVAVRNYFAGL